MMHWLLLLLCCFNTMISGLSYDGRVLLSLANDLVLPPMVGTTWNSSHLDPCSWSGIKCNNKSRVVTLNLSRKGVLGQLGPNIGRLPYLTNIFLGLNNISSRIPVEIGNLTHLEQLDLSKNEFFGSIPDGLNKLSKLFRLSLYNNFLNGGIPKSIFHMSGLQLIYLHSNNLFGSIPTNVGNLTNVQSIWLSNNLLDGEIPDSIGNCNKLEQLYFNNNKLTGTLPGSMASLKRLVKLDVSKNSLKGMLPRWLGDFQHLTTLRLSFNKFEGEIPMELGNCSLLSSFVVNGNRLSGPIPPSIGALSKLTILSLSTNKFSGLIPPAIGRCSSLRLLLLNENQLQGFIPAELGMLQNLTNITLHINNLTGEIPRNLWRIASLKSISLYKNNLSGELPFEIAELKNLQEVYLFNNQFSGEIPLGFGINSSLEIIDFMYNNFIGVIPPFLCFGGHLSILNLGGNQFKGSIPSDVVKNCPTLRRTRLGSNRLTGQLPDFSKNCSLNYLEFSENQLSGQIPESLGNCVNLATLKLSMNQLTGAIPQGIGNLSNLVVMDLSHNNLHGQLPKEISNCHKLNSLDLGFNALNGSIPSSLTSLALLSNLTLQNNLFIGGIPDFLPQLSRLKELRLGYNLLEGSIPHSLGKAQSLFFALDLSGNAFVGGISVLQSLTMLISLDVSLNNLTGNILALASLQSLMKVNISHNDFTGSIPKTLLNLLHSSENDFSGNPRLCIECNSKDNNCTGIYIFKPCKILKDNENKLTILHIVLIVLATVIVGISLCLLLVYICTRKRKMIKEDVMPLILKQVIDATENLNDKYIIGRGGCGTVYKACLNPNTIYAVKLINFVKAKGAITSMKREVEIVTSIKHKNLMRLVNFWLNENHGLILYCYMTNGSLHDVLHEIKPQLILPWDLRYQIALGIAEGLSYLHNDCNPAIVHQDIKPKNVLLDCEMKPYISDFGIANILDQSAVIGHHSNAIIGTFGYMSPESAFSTRKTKASDVYSFGVVLLELLTRKQALDPSFEQNIDLVRWVGTILRKTCDITRIADQGLLNEFDKSPEALEEAGNVLHIALNCTSKDVMQRPLIRVVVNKLVDIKIQATNQPINRL